MCFLSFVSDKRYYVKELKMFQTQPVFKEEFIQSLGIRRVNNKPSVSQAHS